jgi:hypothetical protein
LSPYSHQAVHRGCSVERSARESACRSSCVSNYALPDNQFPVTIAKRTHPISFRTRKLSSSAPMVLDGRPSGRVGRRRNLFTEPLIAKAVRGFRVFCLLRAAVRTASFPTVTVRIRARSPDIPQARTSVGAQAAELDTEAQLASRLLLRWYPGLDGAKDRRRQRPATACDQSGDVVLVASASDYRR